MITFCGRGIDMVDVNYCSSSYLMYRYVFDKNKSYTNKPCSIIDLAFNRVKVKTADELINALNSIVKEVTRDGETALALSGGIDSALLAKFMPPGSKAYTFRCVVPNTNVIDKSERARHWSEVCSLDHEVVDIHWTDIEQSIDVDVV